MVLVAIERHLIFPGPASITIFLTKFVGSCSPSFRGFAFLDLLVLVPRVALTGHFNKTGIDNLAGICKDGLVVKG